MVIEKLGADPDQLSEVPSDSVASVKVTKKPAKRKTKLKTKKIADLQKVDSSPKPKVMKVEESLPEEAKKEVEEEPEPQAIRLSEQEEPQPYRSPNL